LAKSSSKSYLNSEGRRSTRLHFSHSAWFFTLPFSKTVFILISPPQEQKNFCVALVVREFLLACPMVSPCPSGPTNFVEEAYYRSTGDVNWPKKDAGRLFDNKSPA
jgi:hypothetical protein